MSTTALSVLSGNLLMLFFRYRRFALLPAGFSREYRNPAWDRSIGCGSAIADFIRAPLTVKASNCRIEIERVLLEIVDLIVIPRPPVDGSAHYPPYPEFERCHPGERIHQVVGKNANGISRI